MLTVKINKIRPIKDHIIVSDMTFDIRLSSGGIFIPNDDMKNSGIRPRWGRVYAVGPKQEDIRVGQWVCVAHGRWTRGVKIEDPNGVQQTIRRVDVKDVLMVSDEKPADDTIAA